eukprot:237720-Chlamydomonas_euryale.AAC.1
MSAVTGQGRRRIYEGQCGEDRQGRQGRTAGDTFFPTDPSIGLQQADGPWVRRCGAAQQPRNE